MFVKKYLPIFIFFVIACGAFPAVQPTQKIPQPIEIPSTPALDTTIITPVNPTSPLGINLSPLVDYSDEDPFLDYMKMSRPWFGQTESEFDTNETDQIDLDEFGWVKSLQPKSSARFTRVATLMMVSGDLHNNYAGEYVVLYEGRGQFGYGGATLLSSEPGRDVIRLNDAAGYLLLQILFTDPQDYLRNIRVVRKENEAAFLQGAIFNQKWVTRLQPFRTIRFMDWMRINGSSQTDFSLRTRPEMARYTTELGAPLEVMLALTNQLHAEAWFNMPAQADDAYIRAFAELVFAQLHPNLHVYVEYSNEVWNTGAPFHPHGSFIDQQASVEFGIAAQQDFYTARLNWHGKRTAEMCAIWKSVFGTEAERVICVLGAQAANTYTAQQALDCPLWGERCLDYGIDAVAIAPYFGSYIGDGEWQDQVQVWSVNEVFEEILSGGLIRDPVPGDWNDPHLPGALAEAQSFIQSYADFSEQYGLRLLGYEGGQHLAGVGTAQNNDRLAALFAEANRDERMRAVYAEYLKFWYEAGGETLALFNFAGRFSAFGNWGLLEYIEQPSSPKYDAVLDFVNKTPCDWGGCELK